MATPQDCSIGVAVEGTYKTFVTPTRWYEFTDESLNWKKNVVQGKGLRVGSRVPRSGRRYVPNADGGGDVTIELPAKGAGLLWQAALGGATSTIIAATTAYQQVFTLADVPPSLTVQKAVVRPDGTVDPITFLGCMVDSTTLTIPNNDIATAAFTLNAADYTTAQAYVTPSYTASPVNLFHFGNASISIGGTITAPTTTALATMAAPSAITVRDFSLTINNNLQDGRYNFGGAGRKAKPTVGLREITGTMTIEYDSTTYRDAFLNDTDLAVLVNLTGTTNAGAGRPEQFQIVLSNIRFDGDLPAANGGDLITVSLPFTALDNTVAAQPIWITQTTSDTAL